MGPPLLGGSGRLRRLPLLLWTLLAVYRRVGVVAAAGGPGLGPLDLPLFKPPGWPWRAQEPLRRPHTADRPCRRHPSLPQVAGARRAAPHVTVADVGQLRFALADPRVDSIAVVDSGAPGSWNFTAEAWGGQVLLQRRVNISGFVGTSGRLPHRERAMFRLAAPGPGAATARPCCRPLMLSARHRFPMHVWPPPCLPAVDANQLAELVVVGPGGALHLSDLFLDDCLLPHLPLLCFAAGGRQGSLLLERLVLGDAACADAGASTAADWLLKARGWLGAGAVSIAGQCAPPRLPPPHSLTKRRPPHPAACPLCNLLLAPPAAVCLLGHLERGLGSQGRPQHPCG